MENGTELGAQEWRDAVFIRYVIDPRDLLHSYNMCGAQLSNSHTLDRKKVGSITSHHNKLH